MSCLLGVVFFFSKMGGAAASILGKSLKVVIFEVANDAIRQ